MAATFGTEGVAGVCISSESSLSVRIETDGSGFAEESA